MKSIVVTGASTGIGCAVVKALLARGFRVFGSVRGKAEAGRLSAEFGTNFTPLLFDITDADAVSEAAAHVGSVLGRSALSGLVNNAGIAVPGPLLHVPIAELRRQLEVNLIGQMIVTQAFAPLLGTDAARVGDRGRIVMVSSSGGRNALPFNGPYNASKFALEGLSESLRRELMLFGIDVIIVAPGPVATPIWSKAESTDMTPFANTPFGPALNRFRDAMLTRGRKGLPSDRVGELIADALTMKRPKTRYKIMPMPNRIEYLLQAILPKRTVDGILARKLGLSAKSVST